MRMKKNMELLKKWASGEARHIAAAPLPEIKPEPPKDLQFENGCAGKETYRSQTAAATAQLYREHSGVQNSGMVAYKCRRCPGWHVGHPGPAR